MFKKHNVRLLFGLLALVLAIPALAQNVISVPYSKIGIGLVNRGANGVLNSMGGTSYAMQNPYYVNFRNPASYAAFDSLSFVADAAASIHTSVLSTDNAVQKNTYARPDYLAIGLPVTRHWRTSIGVVPFSVMGYDMVDNRVIDNVGNVNYEYTGKGGLNQLYWGNAFKLCKGLSIGLNVSYMFGSFYHYRRTEFEGINFYNTNISDAYHLDGIHLTGGLQYLFKVKENHTIGLGVVYGNTAYIWAKEKLLINYFEGSYNAVTTYDTAYFSQEDVRGSLRIPQSVGGGISYSFKEKFTVAADVTWQNWDKYRFMGHGDSLKNSISGSLGVQYIPDPFSPKFFKRIALRAGTRFSTGEIVLHNKPVSEFGVSLGVGIPLTTFNTHSSINILVEYGKLGTTANDLILQNYFRFTLSFTLQEKWYQRMKIE